MVKEINNISIWIMFLFVCRAFTENYDSWGYSINITINTTDSGANVSDHVINFPLLIRLDTSNFVFSQAMSNGYDIRFSKSDVSRHLYYERERWSLTASDSSAEFWVLCDTVFGNNNTQYIRMYWGNTGAADSSDASAVFGTGNNFSAVWHLNEDGIETALDATSANNDGTASGFTTSSDITGIIGIAREFDGSDDYLQINNDIFRDVLSGSNRKTTLSFWVKADNTQQTKLLIWEGDIDGNGWGSVEEFHFTFGANPSGTTIDDYITLYFGDGDDNSTSGTKVHASEVYSDTVNWHHAAVSLDNSNGSSETAILYIDGIPVDTSTGTVQADFNGWNTNTRIGRPGENVRYFDGILDEVRIANDVRSADWIRLSYESQKTVQSVTALQQTGAAKISSHPQSDTVALHDPAQFTVLATGFPLLTYQWMKDGVILPGETLDTLSIASVTAADEGVYNAIVTNILGSDTSDNAHFFTYDSAITITSQPRNDTVPEGQPALFSIAASGHNCFYQWQKKTSVWTYISGEISNSLTFTAISGDNGTEYRCIVSSGPVSIISDTATLYISTVPVITDTYPSDTAIATGQTLIITAYADAWPIPQYTWYVKTSPDSDSSVVSSGPVLTLSDIRKTDIGYYFFIADNGHGNVRSKTISVYVADPVVINIDLPNILPVVKNGSVKLTPDVSGEGKVTCQWHENGVLLPGDTGSSFTIASVDSASHHGNRYFCEISNTYMNMQISTDTTRVCTLRVTGFYNPFKVKAERIFSHNTDQVRIKLWSDIDVSNFPCKDPVFPPSPWADSIQVFYQSNSYATDPSQTPNAMFSTEQIINAPDTLSDTLTVGPLPQINDSCLWFNYSILWHKSGSSEDTLLRPLTEANKVFMKDTVAPQNPLTVYGEYVMKTDTALLTIDGINSLSVERDSTVTIRLSYYPQFNALTKDTALSIQTLLNGGDRYVLTLDSIGNLPLEQTVMYCRWFITGKNSVQGTHLVTSFSVGWSRPVYAGALTVDSTLQGNAVVATWDPHTEQVDDIRIWWDTSPVPPVHNVQLADDQAHYVTSPTVNTDTIKGLSNNTEYYFGLQILKNDMWSEITSLSSVKSKTSFGDTSQISNSISIDSSGFDDSTNSMVIKWHINPEQLPPNKTVEVGYTFTLSEILDTSILPLKWLPVDSNIQTTSIPLYPDITFDTVNTVGLWLHGVDSILGSGRPNPPTDSSITKIRIPAFTWQEVTFFHDSVDTVYAANKKIMFVKKYPFIEIDTLRSFNPDTVPDGFVKVGSTGFYSGKKNLQIPPFTIGLKYGDLPSGINRDDLGIFQYKNGDFHVLHDFSVDSEAVWSTVSREHLQNPFIVFADTMAPKITVTPFNDTVSKENTVVTEFKISGNNANTFWRFLYGAGHEGYSTEKNGYISGCVSDPLKIDIINNSNNIINSSFGLRAIIVAFDGISADTFNVSRRVRSKMIGAITTAKQEWLPLGTSAHLDIPQLDKIFDKSIIDHLPWEYNTQNLRLFRWYGKNTGEKNSWVEYSETLKNEFEFIPGRLIWCKTAETEVISFGRGVTPSLKESYEIQLKPGNWTDITMPFKFNVMLRDILEATGRDECRNLDVYHWQKTNRKFEAVGIFIGRIDSIADTRDTIKAQQKLNGYTIYNYSNTPTTLRIPPTCIPLSQYTGQTKRSSETSFDSWNISIKWKNRGDNIYRRLRCGYKKSRNNAVIYGSYPPSMSRVKAGILNNENENSICGWSIKPKLIRGGIFFEVVFRNNSDTYKDIEYFLDNLDALPKGFHAKILNPETNTYDSTEDEKQRTIRCSPHSDTRRTVVTGTNQFLDMMVSAYLPLKLLKVFPNPFYKRFRISLRIPIGIKDVQFTLYNLRGQRLLNYIEKNVSAPGYHVFSFDGKTNGLKNGIVPSGVYILQLKAKNSAGSIIYGGYKRITGIK